MMSDALEIQEFFAIIGQQAVRIYLLEKEKKVLQQQVAGLLKEKEDGGLGRPGTD